MIKHKDYEGWPISLTAKELNRSSDGWVVISRPHRDGLFIAAVSLETGMPWGGKIKIAQTVGDVEIARQEALRDLSKMGLGGAMADAGRHRAGRKAAARDNPGTACSCGSAVPSREFDRVLFGWRRVGGAWVCGKCAAVRGNPSGKVPDMKNVPFYERTLDSYDDVTITKVSPSGSGYYATLDWGPKSYVGDPDFASYGRTPKEAIDRAARKIREDARGIGKYAPHSCLVPGHDLHFRLMAHWAQKEVRAATRDNPTRKPLDHKFAGQLFSAGEPKTALAYLRGNLTKTTARELVAGKQAKRR